MSASVPYVLAAPICATLCDGDWYGMVEENGAGSSLEAEMLNYLWIFWHCQRLVVFSTKVLRRAQWKKGTSIFDNPKRSKVNKEFLSSRRQG